MMHFATTRSHSQFRPAPKLVFCTYHEGTVNVHSASGSTNFHGTSKKAEGYILESKNLKKEKQPQKNPLSRASNTPIMIGRSYSNHFSFLSNCHCRVYMLIIHHYRLIRQKSCTRKVGECGLKNKKIK